MPLFSDSSSPYDDIVDKATAETLSGENWALILDICDRVSRDGQKGAKSCLLSIKKRLNHRDPHVVLYALSLLDSCMSNCGMTFRGEVCSREFIGELKSKATHSSRSIRERTKKLISSELKRDGHSFDNESEVPRPPKTSNDPNVVSSQQEEDDIAKAIAESLKSAEPFQKTAVVNSTKMYPSAAGKAVSEKMVKALYDFEAAEENELTFKAGELITVLDDNDINWWKGSNHRGAGLFPSSFVTTDLSAKVPTETSAGGWRADGISNFNRCVGKEGTNSAAASEAAGTGGEQDEKQKTNEWLEAEMDGQVGEEEHGFEPATVVDEELLNQCLETLRDADPTGETPDPPELAKIEAKSLSMAPLIDRELADIDRRHNLLAEVDVKLRDALALYDGAMQEANAQFQQQTQLYGAVAAPQFVQQQPHHSAVQSTYSTVVAGPAAGADYQQQQAYQQQQQQAQNAPEVGHAAYGYPETTAMDYQQQQQQQQQQPAYGGISTR